MTASACKLKNPTGWLAAGEGFRRALRLLSDGGFKLFAHLSLQADRRTGCVQADLNNLAAALNKPHHAIGILVAELRQKGLCTLSPANGRYSKPTFTIRDEYWPYERESNIGRQLASYAAAIRESFLALECTAGKFGRNDIRIAEEFEKQGISLETVQDALLTGACRKFASWLDGRITEPIASLAYFERVVTEIQSQPLPDGYRDYLNIQVKKLALVCKQQQWWKKHVQKIAARDEDDVLNSS
jgi:hypothetical protein